MRKIAFLFITISVACMQAATITWTGAQDAFWSNPNNWTPMQVPGINDDAIFSSAYAKPCNIANDVIVNSITFTGYTSTLTNLQYNNLFVKDISVAGNSGVFYNSGIIEYFRSLSGSIIASGTYSKGQLVNRNEYRGNFSNDILNMFVAVDKRNYIKVEVPQRPISDVNLLSSMSPASVLTQYKYLDAAGRTIEAITKQCAPNREDMIQLADYDEYGRQPKKYLPYTKPSYNGQYQKTKYDISGVNAFDDQLNYYTIYSGNSIPDLSWNGSIATNSFVEFAYDPHDQSRVVETAAPGYDWRMGGGHTDRNSFTFNALNEVLNWSIDENGNMSSNISSSVRDYYPIALLKVVTKLNENSHKELSYYDDQNRLVLKKSMTTYGAYITTAYVYDEFGRLRAIISPEGYKNLASTNYYIDYTSAFAQKYIYYYKYDERGRVVEERQPGQVARQFMYNKLDKQVLIKENYSNGISASLLNFNKYDIFGRIVYSGTYTDASTVSVLQNNLNAQTVVYEKEASAVTTSNYIEGYTNSTFPVVTTTDAKIINFYDDYINPSNYMNRNLIYATPSLATTRLSGRLTGKVVKNLNTADKYIRKYFYDVKGNLLQKIETSTIDPTKDDLELNYYDFKNKLIKQQVFYQAVPNAGTSNCKYYTFLTPYYDHMGRIVKLFHRINTSPEILLASYKYNKIGKLIERNLHSENGGTSFLQSIDYRYNIRGWLSKINNSTLTNDMASTEGICKTLFNKSNDDANDLFGMEFIYNEYFGVSDGLGGCNQENGVRYNGQLSAVRWKTNNPMSIVYKERALTFNYFIDGRFAYSSHYSNDQQLWTKNTHIYERVKNYDDNGNITGIQRVDASYTLVDDLFYTYDGNRLLSVRDGSDKTKGFLDGTTATAEYTYDAKGNLLFDNNKYLMMSYNYLGLATTIYKALDGRPVSVSPINSKMKVINLSYDAEGRLIKRDEQDQNLDAMGNVTSATAMATTQYGNYGQVKIQGSEYIQHSEGRIEIYGGNSFNYIYHIKDHLNHVRVTFDKNPSTGLAQLRQEENFTPLGVRNTSYALGQATNFVLSEKEWEDGISMYDYGWRHYDPMLGRWHNPDKHALLYHDVSPYAFTHNDPVNNWEIDGMDDEGGGYSGGGYSNNGGYNGPYNYGGSGFGSWFNSSSWGAGYGTWFCGAPYYGGGTQGNGSNGGNYMNGMGCGIPNSNGGVQGGPNGGYSGPTSGGYSQSGGFSGGYGGGNGNFSNSPNSPNTNPFAGYNNQNTPAGNNGRQNEDLGGTQGARLPEEVGTKDESDGDGENETNKKGAGKLMEVKVCKTPNGNSPIPYPNTGQGSENKETPPMPRKFLPKLEDILPKSNEALPELKELLQ